MRPADDLPCAEFVELVTAYLDGALPSPVVGRIEAHLALCDGCRTALAQWRTVIAAAGRLRESDVDTVDPVARERLMATFRRVRRR
jgi:anti-sigma factor RsiW